MTLSYDILQHADMAQVRMDPFPHIVIDDALPAELFERLSASFPDPEDMLPERKAENNKRFNLLSRWGATEFDFDGASPDWQNFVEANESTAFVERAFALFPDHVKLENGERRIDLARFGPDLPAAIKTGDTVGFDEVVPRVTVAVNTPVTKVNSVRGPHTDNRRKAYVGLLYFRLPEDDSTGGDLEIYRWKNGEAKTHWPVKADADDVELVETLRYKPNRLIFFLTNDRALHGVSPRSVTPYWRRLVVISGWFPGVDYSDTDTMHGRLAGAKSLLKGALRRALGKERLTSG